MKKLIRLTESDIRRMVMEALSEYDDAELRQRIKDSEELGYNELANKYRALLSEPEPVQQEPEQEPEQEPKPQVNNIRPFDTFSDTQPSIRDVVKYLVGWINSCRNLNPQDAGYEDKCTRNNRFYVTLWIACTESAKKPSGGFFVKKFDQTLDSLIRDVTYKKEGGLIEKDDYEVLPDDEKSKYKYSPSNDKWQKYVPSRINVPKDEMYNILVEHLEDAVSNAFASGDVFSWVEYLESAKTYEDLFEYFCDKMRNSVEHYLRKNRNIYNTSVNAMLDNYEENGGKVIPGLTNNDGNISETQRAKNALKKMKNMFYGIAKGRYDENNNFYASGQNRLTLVKNISQILYNYFDDIFTEDVLEDMVENYGGNQKIYGSEVKKYVNNFIANNSKYNGNTMNVFWNAVANQFNTSAPAEGGLNENKKYGSYMNSIINEAIRRTMRKYLKY